jgi:hypothetical protein
VPLGPGMPALPVGSSWPGGISGQSSDGLRGVGGSMSRVGSIWYVYFCSVCWPVLIYIFRTLPTSPDIA